MNECCYKRGLVLMHIKIINKWIKPAPVILSD